MLTDAKSAYSRRDFLKISVAAGLVAGRWAGGHALQGAGQHRRAGLITRSRRRPHGLRRRSERAGCHRANARSGRCGHQLLRQCVELFRWSERRAYGAGAHRRLSPARIPDDQGSQPRSRHCDRTSRRKPAQAAYRCDRPLAIAPHTPSTSRSRSTSGAYSQPRSRPENRARSAILASPVTPILRCTWR